MRLRFDRICVAAILSAEGNPTEAADDADGGVLPTSSALFVSMVLLPFIV
jgi:hypothetical protein